MTIPYRLANGPGNPPDARKFMANYDWLTAMLFGDFLSNGGMEDWGTTSFSDPANGAAVMTNWLWRKTGTSDPVADVAREAATIDSGVYSAEIDITSAGSADSIVAFDQDLLNPTDLRGLTLAIGAMVRTSDASKVRVKVADGTTTAYSSYHTGGGTFEHLNTTITVAAGATTITVSVEVISDFTGAVYVDGMYTYVIPVLMTQAARDSFAWSLLLARQKNSDLIFGPGVGIVCTSPDGTKSARWSLDNDGAWLGEEI